MWVQGLSSCNFDFLMIHSFIFHSFSFVRLLPLNDENQHDRFPKKSWARFGKNKSVTMWHDWQKRGISQIHPELLVSIRIRVYVCPSPRKLSCKDTALRISTRNKIKKTLTIEGKEISRPSCMHRRKRKSPILSLADWFDLSGVFCCLYSEEFSSLSYITSDLVQYSTMKTVSILALAAPVAAFTSQNNAVRQSTQISETKVRSFLCLARRFENVSAAC